MAEPFPTLEVPPPAAGPRALGTLLNTFEPIPTDDPHWELGYHFPTWGACLGAFRWGPCSGVVKTPGAGSSTVTAVPFTVYAPFRCSTFGTDGDLSEYEDAAREALRFSGGIQVEEELWFGTLAIQNGWPNLSLLDGATDVGGGEVLSAPYALAELQKALRGCLGDDAGVIHASAALVSAWAHTGAIREVDGKLSDWFGNLIVAGSGYYGNSVVSAVYTIVDDTPAPSGGTFTLTVTSPVTGDSETTASIDWDASAAEILAALEALTIVEAGDVVVTGGPLPATTATLTFGGRFAGQDVVVTMAQGSLTGGTFTFTETVEGGQVTVANQEIAFATSMIDVRVGPVTVYDSEGAGSIDRSTNTVELIAEATMSATWDGCCHFSVLADVDDMGGGSGGIVTVGGVYNADGVTLVDGDDSPLQLDAEGNLVVTLGDLIAGEDLTNNVMKVEQRFSSTRATADTLVKSGSGFIHGIALAANGSVTAGVVTIYDNTAESGTIIWSGTVQVTTAPVFITLNAVVSVGIYVGFDGTIANVAFAAIWR